MYVHFRFCTKDYYPFDAKDLKKYVVGDDYTPPHDVSTDHATHK